MHVLPGTRFTSFIAIYGDAVPESVESKSFAVKTMNGCVQGHINLQHRLEWDGE